VVTCLGSALGYYLQRRMRPELAFVV